MFDFHEKRKIRGLLYSKVVIVFILLITALLSRSVYERYVVEREMAERRAEQESELVELKARAAALESEVDHLYNSRGIEEELRSRFDVAKDGEQVVIIVDDSEGIKKKEPLTSSKENSDAQANTSFWDRIRFW